MPTIHTKRLFFCMGNRRHNYLWKFSVCFLCFLKRYTRFPVPLCMFAKIPLSFWKQYSPWWVCNLACAPGTLRDFFLLKLTSKYLTTFLVHRSDPEKHHMTGWYVPPTGCWEDIYMLSGYSISLNSRKVVRSWEHWGAWEFIFFFSKLSMFPLFVKMQTVG